MHYKHAEAQREANQVCRLGHRAGDREGAGRSSTSRDRARRDPNGARQHARLPRCSQRQ